jgi:hypothetical protein
VGDLLAALRRDLHELEHLAAKDCEAGDWTMARFHEQEAAEVAARIDTLEHADGLAYSFPMDGAA